MEKKPIVVLFGATGFIGQYLIATLLKANWQEKVVVRQDPLFEPTILQDVHYVHVDLNNIKELVTVLQDSVTVINLMGVLNGSRAQPFEVEFYYVHVVLPLRIAKAVIQAGSCLHFLQMIALGADVYGPSMYTRSKGVGEQVLKTLLAHTPVQLTIFRPSFVFGQGDSSITRFAALAKITPIFPLSMPLSRFQPIYVEDLVCVIEMSITQPFAFNRTYELGGSRVYTLETIVRIAAHAVGRKIWIICLPRFLSYWMAYCLEKLPGKPILTRDNLDSMQKPNVMDAPWPAEFLVERQALESVVPNYLRASV